MDCMVPGPSWRCYSDVFLLWSLPRNGWQAVLLLVALSVRFIASFIRTGFGKKCKGAPCTLRRFANAAPVHFFWAKLALGKLCSWESCRCSSGTWLSDFGDVFLSSCSPHNQWKDIWFVWKWEIPPVHLHFKRANDDLSLNGLWFSPQFTDTPSPPLQNGNTTPQLEFPSSSS